jgi:hypothetical protein
MTAISIPKCKHEAEEERLAALRSRTEGRTKGTSTIRKGHGTAAAAAAAAVDKDDCIVSVDDLTASASTSGLDDCRIARINTREDASDRESAAVAAENANQSVRVRRRYVRGSTARCNVEM